MKNNPPNIFTATAALVILFALELLIGAGFYDAGIVYYYGDPRASVISVISMGIIITILMHVTGLNYKQLFHASENSLRSTIYLLFPPVFIVLLGSFWWFEDILVFIAELMPEDKASMDMLVRMLNGGVVSIIAICIIAPFLEEMLFRGIFLRGFLSHYSPGTSVLASSLLFSFAHLNLYQIPGAFLLGYFFGWLYYYSRSLWPVIFGHALNNAGAYLLYINNGGEQNSALSFVMSLLLSAIGLVILASLFRIKLFNFR